MGNQVSLIGVNPFLYWDENDQFGNSRDEQMESIEDEQDRELIKHNRKLGEQIRHQIREGRTREEIFIKMCDDLELLEIGEERVYDYFRLADQDIELLEGLVEDYYDLLLKILEEDGKCRSLIALWAEVDESYQFLNSRYGIRANVYSSKRDRLTLSDNFHGQERSIPIECSFDADISEMDISHIKVVDFEHLLLFDTNTPDQFNIYFARLDFTDATCKILKIYQVGDDFVDLILDSEDRHRFLIVTSNQDRNIYLHFGRIEDTSILIQKPPIRFGRIDLLCKRLVGNRLQAILFNENEENAEEWNGQVEFGEFVLLPGQDFPRFQHLFNVRSEVNFHKLQEYGCHWIGNRCFMIGYIYETGIVALLDLDSRTLTKTLHRFYSDGRIIDVYSDEDVLSLCLWNGPDDMREIHRFCLNQPESLFNTVLFKLRKDALFYSTDFHDQLLACLPPYLQPMAILHSTTWPSNFDVPILVPDIPTRAFAFSKFLILKFSKKVE